jgi:hypothetical protein
MIQNLQKDNVRLSTECDGLQDKVGQLQQELTRKKRVTSLIISPQSIQEMAEANEAPPSPVEVITMSPMPPPRSPYRPLNKPDNSLAEESEEPIPINGRVSPGSPAPSPIYSNIRFNATSPNLTGYKQRKGSDPITPSKSTSSSLKDGLPLIRTEEDMPIRAATPPCPPIQMDPLDLQNTNDTTTTTSILTTTTTSTTTNNTTTNTNNDIELLAKNHAERDTLLNNPSSITIRVVGSNIRANDKGKDVVSFTLAIGAKDEDENFDERWRVEKLYSDFLALDSQVSTNAKHMLLKS